MHETRQKIIVIVGPTASGKSALALWLAKKVSGEIISADSRQVYKGLDIGTGKLSKKEKQGVPHYLLDAASPKRVFTVNDFKKKGERAIQKIIRNKKNPIICGGTGFYIQALIDDMTLPNVSPNKKLRERLGNRPVIELYTMLKRLDPTRAKTIDQKNKRRLIRAIEIIQSLGKVPPFLQKRKFDTLFIGLYAKDIKKNIKERLFKRMRQGLISEGIRLHKKGLSYKRMENLGLEYKYLSCLIQNKISKTGFVRDLERAINQYAKRQMTWFKKDKRINWFFPDEKKKILELVRNFYGS